jgi:hypothetical protein
VFVIGADQPGKTGWVKEAVVAAKNSRLYGLVVRNKGATDCHVQIYDLASSTGADAATPEYDLPVYAESFLPFAWAGGRQFHKGIYVRCVTAAGGAAADLIAASDVKFTYDKMDGPLG